MTRLLTGHRTGSDARQGLSIGLALLCALTLLVTTAGPAHAVVPTAPTGVSATAGDASATVSWSAPESDGGAEITSYIVTTSGGVPDPITVLPPFTDPMTTTVTGLTNGTAYTFTVTATNADGSSSGADSNQVTPVAPATAPSSPTNVSATAGNASATVSWSAPASDGGDAITSYTVTTSGGVPGSLTVSGPFTYPMARTVTGLTNGTAYTFTVTATNAAGSTSAESNSVTPSTAPGPPTNVSARAGNGGVTVGWTAPIANGGSPVTSYTATARLSGIEVKSVTVPATDTQATITGLTNGSTYSFRVVATNAAGSGAPSSSVLATPSADLPLLAASLRSGYWMVGADGRVFPFGNALWLGDPAAALGTAQAVDLEPTPSGNGYWIIDNLGRVYAYGDAAPRGNVSGLPAGERVTSLSATPSGAGYWIFTARGRVVPFGDAGFHGDMSAVTLNGPVRDSIPTPSGKGYYMVAADGGIFAFGDAAFYGSMGGIRLNAPVQSLVPDGDGVGYWLVASDGGIFAFDAPFRGSMGAVRLNQPVTGMVRFGNGYLMVGTDGGIFNFSDRPFLGSLGANPPARPIVSVAVLPG